ncbi:cyclodeaminase/cyclohydrolase family protein [Sphingomonas sp.]|uniref:cyclodeaminase/cyclohydrolase family protein n=1 Tax=Sphingomonas sp. TaxID=28214 RepID=UPI002DBFF5FD|nr:cyclodeaminase/cyclohydrolase family protein [Sphingomonas sp.]HEU4968279.1 cyclodeaminase/cyclohydrolase family protein [Sphingomonas sp.]
MLGSIAWQSVAEVLEATASEEPAPGSGAAAALALGLGAACAGKAARITLKHHPERLALAAADARLAEIRADALRDGDGDAACFTALVAHEPGVADRLIEIGEHLLVRTLHAKAVVAEMEAGIMPIMRNDMLAARMLIDSAEAIVRANLAGTLDAQSSSDNCSDAVM